MIKVLIANVRQKLDDRRRYRRALAEIEALTQRELADMRADPVEMARDAYADIFGRKA